MELWAGNPDLPEPASPIPPWPLVVYSWCEKYHTLLVDGGILDQPEDAWALINAAGNAEAEYLQIKAKLAGQFK